MRFRGLVAVVGVVVSVGWAPPLRADVFQASPGDDVEAIINTLQPGDELVLAGGDYLLTERFSFAIAGTEKAPILVRAGDGETPHFHRPNADENIIDIVDAEHVILRGIEFSGGSAGVRIIGARFLTIEDCEIHDTNDVALRANDLDVTYEGLRILRNHIHHTNHTGEGMYLGCNGAKCEVVNSVIEGNYVHHTDQDSVTQGDGIELKEGSYGNIIRDNVIHDTNYPCILTYASMGPPNTIERNVMWNCGDHAIQSAADATIRNNVILSAAANGIAMQPHQSGAPSDLIVVHNTILQATGDAVSVRDSIGSVVIANNALYAQSGRAFYVKGTTDQLVFEGNAGVGPVVGLDADVLLGSLENDFVEASFDGEVPMNPFPAPSGALVASGSPAHVALDDFNGTARDGIADVGAYAYSRDGNPGWALDTDFKAFVAEDPPGTGGSGGVQGPPGTGGRGGSGAAFEADDDGQGCNAAAASETPTRFGWLFALALLLGRRRTKQRDRRH